MLIKIKALHSEDRQQYAVINYVSVKFPQLKPGATLHVRGHRLSALKLDEHKGSNELLDAFQS